MKLNEDLQCAVYYIAKMYNRIFDMTPMFAYNEEDDELIYSRMEYWASTELELEFMCKLVIKCIEKFPESAEYIVQDLLRNINKRGSVSIELAWQHGYLTKAMESSCEEDCYELQLLTDYSLTGSLIGEDDE